jgi:hypothetical protein
VKIKRTNQKIPAPSIQLRALGLMCGNKFFHAMCMFHWTGEQRKLNTEANILKDLFLNLYSNSIRQYQPSHFTDRQIQT